MKNKQTSRFFFVGLVILVLCAVLYLFKSYLLAICTGVLLAFAMANIQNKFLYIFHGKKLLASCGTTFIFCAFFILPLSYALSVIISNLLSIDVGQIELIIQKIKSYELPEFLAHEQIKHFIASIDFANIGKKMFAMLQTALSSTANFLIELTFIIVFFFFSHLYASEFASYIKQVSPMNKQDLEKIFLEIANMMSVVFYSTIANAVLQGFLFAIIAWIFGYDGFLFWILFAFASLIPVIGGALVFVPLCLYEISIDHTLNAIIIAVYCVVVISTLADNFVKPLIIRFINEKLLKKPTRINELLIFFSMFAGIGTFGFWGIILGPAIITLATGVLRLYVILRSREWI